MKRLVSTKLAQRNNLIEDLKDYWNIMKEQLGLNTFIDCKNCILEFLQLNDIVNDHNIEDLLNEVY